MFDADVIIAGAGPAGSVAAMRLAEAGRKVILCDRTAFPRDKACGDGLIPDALAALQRIGLGGLVAERAYRTRRLRTISPRGVEVNLEAPFLVLPRRAFDHMLFERAISAGAEFRQMVVEGPLRDADRVIGVRGRFPGSTAVSELRAPLTLLATGAEGGVLSKFDPGARIGASGFAVRTYARFADGRPNLSELVISLERDLLPGYAWAFPAPEGLINVGVGAVAPRGLRFRRINLRARLDALLAGHGRLGRMFGPMRAVEPYRGAPLRTGLAGSRLGRLGLAIIGEAAGTTYAVTGEGIGKAMESGLVASDLAAAAGDALPTVGPEYAKVMTDRYAARFAAYATAERWVAVPFVADYVIWRATKSVWVRDRLEGIIKEQSLPDRVFSARSIWRLLTHS